TNGRSFEPSPWMRVLLRDLQDPFRILPCAESGSVGGINIIDLANIGSCCFIETQDRGRITATTHFTVDGRIKNAELRGCNMLLDS
ncbi:MAG: acyltransferase, partial [Bacteroidales bacterium]|nr:acyltransferase [Bacteroidales bacterium]